MSVNALLALLPDGVQPRHKTPAEPGGLSSSSDLRSCFPLGESRGNTWGSLGSFAVPYHHCTSHFPWRSEEVGQGKHGPRAVSVGSGFHRAVLFLSRRSRCHGRSVDYCGEREKDSRRTGLANAELMVWHLNCVSLPPPATMI